jgi:uncharacterized protein YbjT (DUF2867 family)
MCGRLTRLASFGRESTTASTTVEGNEVRTLVTGATGTVGRHVVDQLADNGMAVRAVTRRPATAGLPSRVEVVAGDLDQPPPELFEDVDRLYLTALGDTERIVDLAKQAGVRRIVVLSSFRADDFHRAVEVAAMASGLEWTVLRPGMFAANLLDWAEQIGADRVVREPHASARQNPVHEKDIAAVAAAALLTDDLVGSILPLTGPAALTKPEQVAAIGAAIGRDLRFEELSPHEWRTRSALPPFVLDLLLDIWSHAVDEPDPVLHTVSEVVGRPALTLAEWAADNAAAFGGAR